MSEIGTQYITSNHSASGLKINEHAVRSYFVGQDRISAGFFSFFRFSATYLVLFRLSAINITPPPVIIQTSEEISFLGNLEDSIFYSIARYYLLEINTVLQPSGNGN